MRKSGSLVIVIVSIFAILISFVMVGVDQMKSVVMSKVMPIVTKYIIPMVMKSAKPATAGASGQTGGRPAATTTGAAPTGRPAATTTEAAPTGRPATATTGAPTTGRPATATTGGKPESSKSSGMGKDITCLVFAFTLLVLGALGLYIANPIPGWCALGVGIVGTILAPPTVMAFMAFAAIGSIFSIIGGHLECNNKKLSKPKAV